VVSAATPPDIRTEESIDPEGIAAAWKIHLLRSLQDRFADWAFFPVVSLRLPPANCCDLSEVEKPKPSIFILKKRSQRCQLKLTPPIFVQ
jgi:hypothetical protein